MRHLSEIKDLDALEFLADAFEPAAEIFGDEDVSKYLKASPKKAVAPAIKKHKEAVFKLLAIFEGVDESEYHCSVFALPIRLLELMKEPELLDFLSSQGQNLAKTSFGSAMENTKETEEK